MDPPEELDRLIRSTFYLVCLFIVRIIVYEREWRYSYVMGISALCHYCGHSRIV